MLDKAIQLASEKFLGVTDKAGKPYILHCLAVMEKMPKDNETLQIAAVLHDVVEDTDIELDDLRDAGFDEAVVTIVEHVTRLDGETYDQFIIRVSQNAMAVIVKLADLEHNSDIHRLPKIDERAIERLFRYHKAYRYLKSVREVYARKGHYRLL